MASISSISKWQVLLASGRIERRAKSFKPSPGVNKGWSWVGVLGLLRATTCCLEKACIPGACGLEKLLDLEEDADEGCDITLGGAECDLMGLKSSGLKFENDEVHSQK